MTTKESTKNWFVGVSFKEELLSEFLIQQGYRHTGSLGLPVSLRFRKYVDNDLCGIQEEYDTYAQEIRKEYRKHLPRLFEVVRKAAEEFIAFSKTLTQDELQHCSDEELLKKFQQFCQLYGYVAGIGLPIGFLGEMVMVPVLQEKIYPLVQNKELSYPLFTAIISSPSQITTVAQERLDVLAIAQKIFGDIECREFLKLHSANESVSFLREHKQQIFQEIEHHSQQHIWILKTLLLGEEYTVEKVVTRVQELTPENPGEKLRGITLEAEKQKKELNELCSLLPQEFKDDIALFQEVTYFRDARLMWLNEGCYYSAALLREIARRLQLEYDEVIYLLPQEIEEGLQGGLKVPQNEIHKRLDKYALVMIDNQSTLYTGEDIEEHRVREVIRNTLELKGHPASQGKAQGRVKLVKDRTELHKVERGDILVTRLTTPDFVVAMEKAAAIITDLGGITSHAAIVSRELGVPCIVGTEMATKVLKDGDLVEVDANNGIVKILQKSG